VVLVVECDSDYDDASRIRKSACSVATGKEERRMNDERCSTRLDCCPRGAHFSRTDGTRTRVSRSAKYCTIADQ
jgi:hypothetical protein